ncbi:oligosaccharide flippase family protein [Rhizobium sp. NTR19]|uniref:Oligosaccharide flippase family protein n=1 Tax=Neorhizobium turbinariae TaxID=2937795 RepID=A0ABT0IX32_9HYPH|nr:oligosaccharide flippase family protein [Neorhizobium turbinariae]MCK8782443.1 oligosaccharide flippase family protein [Neorhizobium turbinariae]
MRAAGWSIVGYMALQILRISSSLILTRLLMPEMFGVMAVATTIQVSVAMLSDLGLRPAAIQSRMGDDPTYLDTAWTVQFIHGCLIWLVCVLAALTIDAAAEGGILPASSVYAVPELPGILMATSFSCVIAGLQSMKVVSAYRHLDLKRLTAIEIAAQVISLLVAIALAWSTGSIWSFVISTLVAALVTTGLSHAWLQGRTNVFRWHKDAVVDLIRFGRWIILSSMLTVVAASGDRFFLAGWVGPFTLGLYVLAFNLVAMLEGAGGRLFSSVAMPALSKVARDQPERLRAMFLKVRLPFDLVFVAGAGAVFSAGQMLTDLLYDDRYRDAGPMIQVLSFGLLTARYGTLSAIYLVVNEPRNQTVLNLVRAVSIFTSMPLAYHLLGFNGALWAIAIYGLPGVFVSLYFNGRHGLNNLLYEFSVLAAWPAGYAAGHLASLIYYAFKIDL